MLLEVRSLCVRYDEKSEPAVRDVSFSLDAGEILGLVGESGSGKSAAARAIMGLLPADAAVTGQVLFDGADLTALSDKERRKYLGSEIGMVFQEPLSAMDPLMRVGRQVEETLRIHTSMSAAERKERALEALAMAGLPEPGAVYRAYPHMLSGGMLQRAMIAAAIAAGPRLLILDEPTTALDVTVQAQILNLLKTLNETQHIAMLFISHDLGVVRKICPGVAVMQKGEIVETGETQVVFRSPQHPYTKLLLAAKEGSKQEP